MPEPSPAPVPSAGADATEGEPEPSQKKKAVYHRYYHMFEEGELEELFRGVQGYEVEIERHFFDHANWAAVVRRVK